MKKMFSISKKTSIAINKIFNKINKILNIGLVRKFILIICACVFLFSSTQIGLWLYENYMSKKTNDTLAKISNANENTKENLFEPDTSSSSSEQKPIDINKIKFLTTDISELKKLNADTIGWIKMLDCNIDYPVVQTDNNDYYLSHDFNRVETRAGWIFGDYRCDFNRFSFNTIIYGHARYDYSMFGGLTYTVGEWWYKDLKNHFIWLNTEYDKTVWQIFSIYEVDPEKFYYWKTDFSGTEDYISFLQEIKAKNQIPTLKYDVTPNDKILTLSTCRGSKNRLVVHAKLVKIENIKPFIVPISGSLSFSSSNGSFVMSSSNTSSSKNVSSSKIENSSNQSSSNIESNISSDILSSNEQSSTMSSTDSGSSQEISSDVISSDVISSDVISSDLPPSSE